VEIKTEEKKEEMKVDEKEEESTPI